MKKLYKPVTTLLILLLLYLFYYIFDKDSISVPVKGDFRDHFIFGEPIVKKGELFKYTGYYSSYNYDRLSPNYVAYKLKGDWVNSPKAYEKRNFKVDKRLKKSAKNSDYKKSGYDRGHLARQADMRGRGEKCEKEALFFTNISPQKPQFNRKIWLALEDAVQKWAINYDSLWVITGPCYDENIEYTKTGSELEVPDKFFKIIGRIDKKEEIKELKTISFLIDQDDESRNLELYIVSIDSIEHLTNIDFFHLLNDTEEDLIEKDIGEIWKPYR
ncbi:MAG: hypothetical protein CR982_03265 [Candidatus Cloacimonadota bacterium]|nr:MAG: hypothetical protein CR982_03265 [Candidatus Cloacimonadota bacterium]PIE77405.1 MAG: hypothetical protein CSA15_13065 [Candidatus Delongbacteria bacterium]